MTTGKHSISHAAYQSAVNIEIVHLAMDDQTM